MVNDWHSFWEPVTVVHFPVYIFDRPQIGALAKATMQHWTNLWQVPLLHSMCSAWIMLKLWDFNSNLCKLLAILAHCLPFSWFADSWARIETYYQPWICSFAWKNHITSSPPLFPKSDLDRVPSTLAFQKHQAFPSSLGQAFIFGLILRSAKDFRLEPEAIFGPICPEMNKTWTQNHVLNIKLTCTWILNKDWRNLFLLVKSSLIVLKSNFPMAKWRSSSRSLYFAWQFFMLQGKRMFLAPRLFFAKSITNTEIMYIILDLPTSWKYKDWPCFKRLCRSCLEKYELLIFGVVKCLWKQQVLVDIALLLALLDSDLDLRSSGRKGPWKMLHLIGPTDFRHIDVWGWNLKWIIQINDLQFVLDLFLQIEIVWHVCYRFLGSS